MNEFHVHRVNGGEDICCSLYDTFTCFWHCNWCACCDKYWLITATKRQIWEIMTLNKNNFLITESHLSSSIPMWRKKTEKWEWVGGFMSCMQPKLKMQFNSTRKINDLIDSSKAFYLNSNFISPADIHTTQEHSFFAVHIDIVMMQKRWRWLMDIMRSRTTQLTLNGIVVLLVNDIVDRVTVYEQIFHWMS